MDVIQRKKHVKEHGQKRRPQPRHLIIALALGLAFAWSMLNQDEAQSEPKSNKATPTAKSVVHDDFGAETVEPLASRDSLPLPAELVEELETEGGVEQIEKTDIPAEISKTSALNGEELEEKTTVLNVNDVEIATLVKTFSKLTKRNYIVDSAVKGKVTIYLPSAVTIAEALRVFDSVLLLKGFTTVPVGNNIWKVIVAKDAKQTTIPLIERSDTRTSDALVTQLFRTKNIPAQEIQQLLSQFISKDGFIQSVPGTNSIVVVDSSSNLLRLKELIAEVDVPALDQDITIVPILHADAEDVAEKINEILSTEEESSAQNAQAIRTTPATATNNIAQLRSVASAAGGAAASGSSRRALPLKIIPDKRTNSLIVVADQDMTLKVRALAEQLDSKVDQSGGRFWVYRLEHADAEELGEILSNLISGSSSSSDTSSKTQGSSISRSRASARSEGNTPGSRFSTRNSPAAQAAERTRAAIRPTTGTTTTAEGGRVNFEGEVSIAADPATNSLIVNSSKADFEKLREVIKDLDVKRRQVLVEATILEVSLSEDEGMGVELQGTAGTDDGGVLAQTNFGGITNLLTNPAALTDLTIAAASSGTLTLPGGITIPSQALLITAVSRHSNVNVLSAPTILSTDNEEAEIIVGENVPFVTGTSTDPTNLNNTFNSIERQDVGITLRITPQISTGDYLVLKIFIEISNVVAGTRNDPNGPTTTIRTQETTVAVKNKQMIVTGGLIQDSITDSTRGVPFLQDIPVLGQYFKRQDNNTRRTNLLVFLTPQVISDQFEAREETKYRAGQLESEITNYDIQPSREEILHHPNLDNVLDSVPDEINVAPSTITPPSSTSKGELIDPRPDSEEATRRTTERLKQLLPDKQELSKSNDAPRSAPKTSGDQPLEFSVKPKLPGGSANIGDAPEQEPRGKIREENLRGLAAQAPEPSEPLAEIEDSGSAGTRSYVVLREISPGPQVKPSAKLRYADNLGTLGLIVPGSQSSRAGGFFEVGKMFEFSDNGEPRRFVCLGVYSDQDEAGSVHSVLDQSRSWQTLSPKDSLLLGSSQWFQK